nr:immunoglobulin light chain junction region [Mus musculus]NSL97341.1 immunoglobulin light chain junction region [Mus musculus]NSL97377.1 immunoglobulin light chain junction region [Mus musculus]NSL97576.1 immunoglobulin light chain junction region [Mus musculus]NSL97839.1 immunoglobulin light chain junction region [Mus musculus]
CFQGSHVPWTF